MKVLTKKSLIGVLTTALAAMTVGTVSAKSLYVIADINFSPTPIQTYDIQNAPNYLVYQATQGVPAFAGGAVGLGIDNVSAKLFVTYEVSNTIQLLDGTNFDDLGTTTAPGASNLAGITVDQGKNKVYTVDRNTSTLYVYSWVSATNTLTLDGGAPVQLTGVSSAHGLALDETLGRLYVGDNTLTTVYYYDTNSLATSPVAPLGSVDLLAESQTIMGVAIDSQRGLLYTGNAYPGYGSLGKLVKYDLNTDVISAYVLPNAGSDNILGVAVDEDTGNVYATTGHQGSGGTDTLIVFDSDLNVLKNDIGDIGNPTGIAIPRADISFNPLNLSKSDTPDPVETGAELTYTICFDNADNSSEVNNVSIVDTLPAETIFVSATGGGVYDSFAHTVTWSEGTVDAGAAQQCHDLLVTVTAAQDTTILNAATIDSDDTPPTTQREDTSVIPIQTVFVAFDVKPQSCRNPLNVRSGGVLPAAILGSDELDVSLIDPSTIKLAGVSPIRWKEDDVATPYEPFIGKQDAFDCTTAGPDGYTDLTLKFKKTDIISALGDVNDGDVLVLTVTAELLDGTDIEGEDVIVILH